MIEIIKKAALDVIAESNPVSLTEAEVTKAPPDLEIKLASNDKLRIPKQLIVVSESLCKHKKNITLRNSENLASKIRLKSSSVTTNMTAEGTGPHTHTINELQIDNIQNDFDFSQVELEFLDELKVGEKVLVIRFQGGQKFYIVDRVISYE